MMITPLRLHLTLAAFVVAFAFTLALGMPTETVTAQRVVHLERTPMPLTVKNAGARLVHLNLGHSNVIALAPLKEVTLDGAEAEAAKAVLDGPLAGLVDNGELVVDGKPKAPAPSNVPTRTGDPLDQLNTPGSGERDTDPLPPAASVSGSASQASAAPPPDPSSGGSSKRRT